MLIATAIYIAAMLCGYLYGTRMTALFEGYRYGWKSSPEFWLLIAPGLTIAYLGFWVAYLWGKCL